MASIHADFSKVNSKFVFATEKLLGLTNKKPSDKKQIESCLRDINEFDYKYVIFVNNDAVSLLIHQLCSIVLPTDTALVQSTSKFLGNLCQNNVKLPEGTLVVVQQWILEFLKFSQSFACKDAFVVLKHFLITEQFSDLENYLPFLLGSNGVLTKHLNSLNVQWSELHYHTVGCLEGIILNKCNGVRIPEEFIYIIKDMILKTVSCVFYSNDDTLQHSKILRSCLHILYVIMINKLIPCTGDVTGEILGIVQAFLFYGVKEYSLVKPQLLRPAAMNLPERMHVVPKCKNLKNHKAKSKKQLAKKTTGEVKTNTVPDSKTTSLYSSDSDASDSESNNVVYLDSKVRLEAIRLLQSLIENTQSREIFGYWPQIVATGSRNDARVLSRSILREPVSKVKQNVLTTLTELLIDAKPFLIHAEEACHTSFITFFGTVCLMVKELHFTLSLALNVEKNVAVLTHALKCAAALIQGTPYARLKPGLITKLTRNCRPYIFHKDPTVRVAALSTFEAVAASEPATPEILAILGKQSIANLDENQSHLNTSCISEIGAQEEQEKEDEEEVDVEDLKNSLIETCGDNKTLKEENISPLVRACLENISNKAMNMPVRVQSLKLIGRMAFNTRNLVFPYLELITTTLIAVVQDSETQVVLHVCRALEIMAGCLRNNEVESSDSLTFWNIIFESMTLLAQHSETALREAACDCLGTISSTTFTQISRQKAVLIITVLFGASRDEESAVRAAGLRALGMLVTLPPLEEETGFLMDLADIVCLAANDKNLGVRVKGAWSLANLCDCLSRQKNNEEAEPLPLKILLPKLYHVSVKAAKDSDKVKCNAVRALGSILHMCPQKYILNDTSLGLDALINCAVLGNDMKVRWNACRALGLVLSHDPDSILPLPWRDQVFPALCNLICDSPNFKVRTNAAWALYSCNSYGKYTITLWKSIVLAFENSQHVPSYVEYPHRDALVQQLCLTLSHVAACTQASELKNLWAEIGDHVQDISNLMKQFQETIVPEKISDLIQAKSQLETYEKCSSSLEERQIAQTLASIFERTKRYDNLDIIKHTV